MSVSYVFGYYKIQLNLRSEGCEDFSARADIINVNGSGEYQSNLIKTDQGFYKTEFPLRSKILALSFCPESEIILSKITLIFGDRKVNLDPTRFSWVCRDCDIEIRGNELIVKTNNYGAELESADIIKQFPFSWRLLHIILRYTPYIIVYSFILYLTGKLLPGNRVIYKVAVYSSIFIAFIYYYFDNIRNVFPSGKVRESRPISLSSFKNVSSLADYVIIGTILVFPFTVYLILKISRIYSGRNHPNRKNK